MQNKGLIKLFAILFGLVSIYQLSFTGIANKIEKEAIAASNGSPLEEVKYLDSISNDTVYDLGLIKYSYKDVRDKALNKGLDLKGGMNVILQISVKDILEGLSNNTQNETFNQALAKANEYQRDAQESYVESFFRAFDEIKGNQKLASPEIFFTKALSEEVKLEMTDDEVKPIIERKVDESIVSAFEVLRKRIDQFGVTQPNIQRLGKSGRILVELPGAKDVRRIEELITTTAQLEFWETNNNTTAIINFLIQANEKIKEMEGLNQTEETTDGEEATDGEDKSNVDDLLQTKEQDSIKQVNPLFELLTPTQAGGGIVGIAEKKNQAKISKYLNSKEVQDLMPAELSNVMFLWGKEKKQSGIVDLYAIQGNRNNTPQLSGGVVVDARQSYDQFGANPTVSMQMNGKGAKIWEEMTGKAFKTRGNIAIVLDSTVYSAPGVSRGAISGGNSEISGDFTLNEAIDLANVLRAGKLPAKAEILQSDVIGPSLGQEAIDSGINSFIIALILVLIWMIFYYGKAGIFADIALVFNILLIFGALANFKAVLTLPGIAGIVLTIGMSVDANVLLYERVREELAKGKALKDAIAHAFSWKGAMSSIIDANITTGLTALILFLFGTGPIKGFATTLLIGIFTSLFTAIFITRLLIEWYVGKGNNLDFSTSITKNLFRNMNVDFLKKRKTAYIVSGILILVSIGSIFFGNKLNQGIDFVGGRSYQVRFEKDVNAAEVAEALTDVFVLPDGTKIAPEVKTFGNANQLKITTTYKINETATAVDNEIKQKLFDGLKGYLADTQTIDEFQDESIADKTAGIMSSSKVGPTIADDIKKDSGWAIFGSLAVVFLYILLRFRKWQFSLGAVAAVAHDVLIVLGIFSLAWKYLPFNMEINQAFIAAILTVIGYSLNDTVVVFDRIREFMDEHSSWKLSKVVNGALNSTLSRTLNTSLTTLVVLLAIFIFGGESIRGFMFALIVGVLVGTYSSMFIATPIMYDTIKKGDINKGLEDKE